MFTNQLALISQTGQVNFSQLSQISAALQKQITRDFYPIWKIQSSIDAFGTIEDVPPGYWPIIIKDNIGYNAAGIHLDRNGQPYALVQASGESTGLTCSHECLEMLVDPFGNRFVSSNSLIPEQGRVNFLVEVCDPSEADAYAYSVNGIVLSDFYTPNYFDPVYSSAVRYSFTNAIKKPREVLKGGYISWMIPQTGEWWQAVFFRGNLEFRNLGVLSRENSTSWRELIDTITFEPLKAVQEKAAKSAIAPLTGSFSSAHITASSKAWAHTIQEDIEKLIASRKNK